MKFFGGGGGHCLVECQTIGIDRMLNCESLYQYYKVWFQFDNSYINMYIHKNNVFGMIANQKTISQKGKHTN